MIGWIAFWASAYSINRLNDELHDHTPKTERSYRNLTIAFVIIQLAVITIVVCKGELILATVLALIFMAFMACRQAYRQWTLTREEAR